MGFLRLKVTNAPSPSARKAIESAFGSAGDEVGSEWETGEPLYVIELIVFSSIVTTLAGSGT